MIGAPAAAAGGFGGHTIGLALAQTTRLLPDLVTVLGWESCDHTRPVHGADTVYSALHIRAAEPDGTGVRHGCVRSYSPPRRKPGAPDRQVLDWRFTALHP